VRKFSQIGKVTLIRFRSNVLSSKCSVSTDFNVGPQSKN